MNQLPITSDPFKCSPKFLEQYKECLAVIFREEESLSPGTVAFLQSCIDDYAQKCFGEQKSIQK